MSLGRSPRKLPVAKRRELEVAAAVAREEVMQFHVSSALRLIELAAGRVSATRMVGIYIRLHGFSGAQADLLTYRALAALGQPGRNGAEASLYVENEETPQQDATSLLRVLRGRLRGRTHHDLRRWVELATGAVQVRLLEIHVRHAFRFARELGETHGVGAACRVYSSMVGLADALNDLLYAFVLERLATEELPPQSLATPAPPERVALFPRSHRSRRAG